MSDPKIQWVERSLDGRHVRLEVLCESSSVTILSFEAKRADYGKPGFDIPLRQPFESWGALADAVDEALRKA